MCVEPTKPPVVTIVRRMTIYIKGIPDFRSCVIAIDTTARAAVMAAGLVKIRSEHISATKTEISLKSVKLATLKETFSEETLGFSTRRAVLSTCAHAIVRAAIFVQLMTHASRAPEETTLK